MFLRWDAIRVVVKYGWDAIRVVVKYLWDAIHVEKGFRDAIHVQRCLSFLTDAIELVEKEKTINAGKLGIKLF